MMVVLSNVLLAATLTRDPRHRVHRSQERRRTFLLAWRERNDFRGKEIFGKTRVVVRTRATDS